MPHPSPLEAFPKPRPVGRLSAAEKALIVIGQRGDELLINFQKLMLRDQVKGKKLADKSSSPESQIDLSFYTNPEFFKSASNFYKAPHKPIEVTRKKVRSLKGGVHEKIEFPSLFETVHPEYREAYRRYEENQTGHAHYWHHNGKGRPTLLIIHGWMGGSHRVHEREFLMPWLYRLGLDIVFFQQPFHGKRNPKQSRFSGQLHPSSNPARTNEAFAQAIFDLRSLMRWLEAEGAGVIGATGSSLGGYVTSLLASTEKKLDFAIPIIPPAAISDLFWEQGRNSPRRREAERRGVTAEIFRRLLAVNSPLTYKPLVPKERRFIVAGLGDRLVPPSHPYALWKHWDECRMHWYPGGHIAQFRRGLYFREIRDFLREISVIS